MVKPDRPVTLSLYQFGMRRFTALLLLVCVLFAGRGYAQTSTVPLELSGVSYHKYFSAGELTLQVFLISSAGGTGIYEIGTDTRLMELVTLAGFAPHARSSGTTRRIDISVIRPRLGNEPIYKSRIEDFVLEPERHPALEEGDVVMVDSEQRRRFSWRDAVQIISGASSLILLVTRISGLL